MIVPAVAAACLWIASALQGTQASPTVAPVPPLTGRVNDTAGALSNAERRRLAELIAAYEHETHHQIAVLTVPTLSGEPIESFSLRVANTWKIGNKGLDDGMVITLCPAERQVRIELGTGMARYISDAETKSIIDDAMIPHFRQQEYAQGLEAGLQLLMQAARRYVVTASLLRQDGDYRPRFFERGSATWIAP